LQFFEEARINIFSKAKCFEMKAEIQIFLYEFHHYKIAISATNVFS